MNEPYPKAAAKATKITPKTPKSAIVTYTAEKNALALKQSQKTENTSGKGKITKTSKSSEPEKMIYFQPFDQSRVELVRTRYNSNNYYNIDLKIPVPGD